ncbi:unnamed protein product [Cylicocyclus nassatus]|uniref:Uncharacterized protein n=1 Tax=Cylicocyclus nassatus TaxID=53992 RepID=A0AA36GWA6_CYLNA|nr:unnamed protein product [Cylicocyclus nassatus]
MHFDIFHCCRLTSGRFMVASDVNTQLSVAQLRQLKEKVELAGRRLRKLVDETRRNEEKLCHMRRRKKTLESDLERRLEIEKSGTPDVSGEVLRELEKPLDYEIETAQQFQARMAHVRSLMSELLVRTNLNEWAAHTEMAEQESEVVTKIRDACKAREMLREALLESQAKAEKAMAERKTRYEELQRLEAELEACSAETWLAITEKNRLSDRLAILTREPLLTPCERVKKARDEEQQQQDRDTSQTENNIDLDLEVNPNLTRSEGGSEHFRDSGDQRNRLESSRRSISIGRSFSSDRSSSGYSVHNQDNEDLVIPVNIMNTIRNAIRDSMGLDVNFD